MKNLILLALGFFLLACASQVEHNNNDKKNVELVKAYIKSVEELDFDSMNEYMGDNYLGMGPSYGDSIHKAEAIENWKYNVSFLYEKVKYDRSRCVAVTIPDGDNKGEWVSNWAELNIVYKGEIGSVTIWANTNYLVENGKIVRSITFYNEADALRQLDFVMVPANFLN